MKRFFLLPLIVAMLPTPSQAAILLKTDFDATSASTWPDAVGGSVSLASVGTIDVENSSQPSKALLLTVHPGGKSAALVSGLLPVKTTETNLGKLTLSFSLSASTSNPITVRVESFDNKKKRTGGLVSQIDPAAPDFYQRYALDLNTMKPRGTGKFQPTAPYVQFTFEGDGSATKTDYQLRLDNVNYATPAYYVSPKGSDMNDGLTEKTAFATPQKALDMAQPGDICVLMEGTYSGGDRFVASFPRAGAPDAWITLKNYPGQTPTLTATAWDIVSIKKGSKDQPYDGPTLAYLEVRGLHIRGEGDVAMTKYADAIGKVDSHTNSNGIAVDGRAMTHEPHHLRFADNLVEYCPACGLATNECDWVTIENNIARYNSWTTIYGTSGISTLGASNFDTTSNVYKILIKGNISYRNETFVPSAIDNSRYTDGNGIIIDVNQKTNPRPNGSYIGRTLVENNLCFDNGGSGIHTVRAYHVDIVNNTAYLNSASSKLQYPEIFCYTSEDVRILNNIMVAPVANLAAGEKPEPVNTSNKSPNVLYSHNLYFGGNLPPTMGEGDQISDPMFVNASRDFKVADFHLKANSPAIGKGANLPFGPFLDLDGKQRKSPPTVGAYEK